MYVANQPVALKALDTAKAQNAAFAAFLDVRSFTF
jgi:hypothetical protein